MRFFAFLKRRAALLAEIETLRAANRKLTEDLETAQIQSWMRLHPSAKPLLLPEKQASKRPDPHVVPVGRHARAEPVTEVHPRISARPK